MKTIKRIIAVVLVVVMALVVGYLVYTGRRLASAQNEANNNNNTQLGVVKEMANE